VAVADCEVWGKAGKLRLESDKGEIAKVVS
jgi:hypothetical protein